MGGSGTGDLSQWEILKQLSAEIGPIRRLEILISGENILQLVLAFANVRLNDW